MALDSATRPLPCPDTAPAPDERLRPRLLAAAAARVARHYRRERDLPQLLPARDEAGESLLVRLAAAEARSETARRAKAPGYRPSRHVALLGALIAEGGA